MVCVPGPFSRIFLGGISKGHATVVQKLWSPFAMWRSIINLVSCKLCFKINVWILYLSPRAGFTMHLSHSFVSSLCIGTHIIINLQYRCFGPGLRNALNILINSIVQSSEIREPVKLSAFPVVESDGLWNIGH